MNKKVFWEHREQPGSEYLSISENDSNIIAEGLVLFKAKEDAHKFSYKVVTDNRWFTKSIVISDLEFNETLYLYSRKGKWYSNNDELYDLRGAIDVDISITPFSNTLPINRFKWEKGQERNFHMLYIDVPSLDLIKLEQQYKLIGYSEDGIRKFRYNCRNYETVITVDHDGFIIEYPDIFIRRY